MVTNKALAELKAWAAAAHEGRGEEAKQHLVAFGHISAGIVASGEFRRRSLERFAQEFTRTDVEQMMRLLDAVASIEVEQVQHYGQADTQV
ncbi:MAG: hypothetical protein DWQ37_19785 [Planctomycetota bacterium]|nr:MAG: hypothetical protein DWQ37_19785 [Planctomycetota bacterium]